MIRVHSLQSWYAAFRKRGRTAKEAISSARHLVAAETECATALARLTPASRARVEAFVDSFIRGEAVEYLTNERDSDFINEPERAGRCHDAAEYGSDGKTHAEVIQDWRDAFGYWMRDRGNTWHTYEHFTDAVQARFTATELWHEFNGSLWEEIG